MMVSHRALIAASLVVCALGVGVPSRAERLDGALRESVSKIPVPEAGADIVVTNFRPPGAGRFPWIVLSHGTATSKEANLDRGRWRPLNPVREWLRRGYAVIVPMRRGYGSVSAEHLDDDYGSCAHPDFRRAGDGAALDLLATVAWAKRQGDLDPDRWLLVGQSSGAFASIYTAAKHPAGLVAVLAFSPGRGGDPDKRPGAPCGADRMASLFASIAPEITVPVLWFYAENDQFIGARVQRLWFEHFRAAGGIGELVVVPPFSANRGHGVFPSDKGTPLWTAAVGRFFQSQGVAMPF